MTDKSVTSESKPVNSKKTDVYGENSPFGELTNCCRLKRIGLVILCREVLMGMTVVSEIT